MTTRTTQYRYNLDGLLEELVSWNGEDGEQVTRWEYGTNLNEDGSGIARADLARAKVYPDSGRVEYGFNRLTETTRMQDQNGTVHDYEYDTADRLSVDRVTTLGAGIDGTVRAIRVSYFARGEKEKVTSYNSPSGIGTVNVVNEVRYAYNGFGQEITEWQSHAGVVNTGTTPAVGYAYEDGSSNTIRRTAATYPNGQVIGFAYDGVLDTAFDRATKIQYVAGTTADLAIYSRLGLNTVVRRLQANGLEMTAIVPSGQATGDAGDIYIGYDRFGRLEDARWIRTSNGAGRERVEYGFDRVGNRVWRRNREAPSELFDEAYRYDPLYQVKALDRGKLNQSRTAIGGVPTKGERWDYDAMGNWLRYQTLENAEPDVDRAAVYNAANELLFLAGTNATVDYDAAGNMTKAPRAGSMGVGQLLKWDAWNRLVEVADLAGTPLGKYAYDGLARRISKQTGFPSAATTRHYFYSDRWQVLEERLDSSASAERQFVWGLQGLDDLICRDELNTSTGALTRRLWALNDGKNVTGIALGNDVVERYAYDAFGTPEVLKPDFTPWVPGDVDYAWETLFCGYRWDKESMLYPVRYRFYHPELGRWLSRDQLFAYSSSISVLYVANSPFSYCDPFGLWIWEDHHWFSQEYRGEVAKLCRQANVDIDAFTTPVDGSQQGTMHWFIHHVLKYNLLVGEAVGKLALYHFCSEESWRR